MITGAHFLLYSHDSEADRAFFRDVLGLHNVDSGGGWLIFRLPPSEIAVHPVGEDGSSAGHKMATCHFYLMCDDLSATVQELDAKGVKHTKVETERWGITTTISLPSGAEIGLYQPTHPTAI